jgi:hypothetical protein
VRRDSYVAISTFLLETEKLPQAQLHQVLLPSFTINNTTACFRVLKSCRGDIFLQSAYDTGHVEFTKGATSVLEIFVVVGAFFITLLVCVRVHYRTESRTQNFLQKHYVNYKLVQ